MKTTKKKKNLQKNKVKAPFITHLLELRMRLSICLGSIIFASIFGYLIRDTLLKILLKPFGHSLYYLTPSGGFDFIVSVCLIFGVLVSIPIIFYEVIRFIMPAFPTVSRLSMISILIFSFLLMIAGVCFAYFISLPAAFNFLDKFGENFVKSLISADSFLSFILHYLFGFGVLFELPLVMLVINSVHKLSFTRLLGLERWVILFSTIFSAVITPTSDIFNMAIMAVPIIILYQISMGLVVLKNRKRYSK